MQTLGSDEAGQKRKEGREKKSKRQGRAQQPGSLRCVPTEMQRSAYSCGHPSIHLSELWIMNTSHPESYLGIDIPGQIQSAQLFPIGIFF